MSEWMQPEPWVATTHCHPKPPSPPCSAAQIEGVIDGPISWTAARRIVACVNACAGIPTEGLEGPVSFMRDVTLEREALRAQVADLRAVLEAISNEADEWDDHDGRLAHVAYPTILDARRVLAATQPQEVQA